MKLALWTLPRWFAAPVALSTILLGYFIAASSFSWVVIWPLLSGLFLMAWGHTMNTWLDFYWTKLDQGEEGAHSLEKPYTGGQQVLVKGETTGQFVLLTGIFYLGLSFTFLLPILKDHWVWAIVPWSVAVLSTFWYSWGKLHYQCELALGIGFGPCATLLGASVVPDFSIQNAVLVGLPTLLIFGFAAEIFDQWYDAEANWDKGLRNIGALYWRANTPIWTAVGGFIVVTYLIQWFLIEIGVLPAISLLTLVAIPGLIFTPLAARRVEWAINALLASLFTYVIMLPVGVVMA